MVRLMQFVPALVCALPAGRAGTVADVLGPIGATVAGGVGTLIVAVLWIRLFPAQANRDRLVPSREAAPVR